MGNQGGGGVFRTAGFVGRTRALGMQMDGEKPGAISRWLGLANNKVADERQEHHISHQPHTMCRIHHQAHILQIATVPAPDTVRSQIP